MDYARSIGTKDRRELEQHWQTMVWEGHGAWAGDPFVVLKENVLTLEIEAWYEVPNQEPQKIFSIPGDEFDINLLCEALHKADNRNVSAKQKLQIVDAKNAARELENAKRMQEVTDESVLRVGHALLHDNDPGAPKVHVITKKWGS